jgi:uncharacterized membrane protein YphA (DoxX/SURF4 family)
VGRYWLVPTVGWLSASDAALKWQCLAGVGLSVLLLVGIAPALTLFLLWALYLSLQSIGSPFLDFQWDLLLLETGFLAIFFAPLQWVERSSRQSAPSTLALWLLRWLLFRLMFESGCVKLMSGDISWWNLSALRYHYETQPLPTWIGWYAHQLPAHFQAFCTFAMLGLELVGPVLIFAGRRARLTAAGVFIFFQVLILLTGNYTFFNYLTIVLCIILLDDDVLAFRAARGLPPLRERCRRWSRLVTAPLAVIVVLVTSMGLMGTLRIPERWSALSRVVYGWLEPLHSFNGYGLFAVMTVERPEIIVEGSNDGKTWVPYEFKYKPGALDRRPRFIAPYQPRLDWQMWFAALSGPDDNPWFLNFEARLLQNDPAVLALMGPNPFPNAPPRYVRAQLYQYHFTNLATRRATGNWWRRDYTGLYLPPIGLTAH